MATSDLRERDEAVLEASNSGNIAYALEMSRDLLLDHPNWSYGWLRHGTLLCDLSRYDEAEKSIRRSLSTIPDESLNHAYAQMGHLFKERGNYEDAERYYRRAIELAPDHAGPHIYLGALLAIAGRLDAAEKAHRDGTRCSQGVVYEAYLNLGFILRAKERYDEARDCFLKALEINPDCQPASMAKQDIDKVLAYLAVGDAEEG